MSTPVGQPPLGTGPAWPQRARNAIGAIALAGAIVLGTAAGDARASFGVKPGSFTTTATESDGAIDLRAGSHPYEYIVSFGLNVNAEQEPEGVMRDALADLPPGLIGNPLAVPRCPRQDFAGREAFCPGNTQVGVAEATLENGLEAKAPIFDLVPPPGVPAQLGFAANGLNGILDASVRTGAGYGVRVGDYNVPIYVSFVKVRIWGVPPEASHDRERQCVKEKEGVKETTPTCSSDIAPEPFLTLPTSCGGGPLVTTLEVDSIEEPGIFRTASAESLDANSNPAGLRGCEALTFAPALTLQPEAAGSEEPSGPNVVLKVPQPESPEGLAEADLKEAQVVLHEGVTVSPSAANGLTACAPDQIDLSSAEPAACPESSKVGTVSVRTPLLEEELEGSVYVAQQGNEGGRYGSNPFGSLLAIYVVVEGDGVVAKIPGEIELEEGTGRITAKFGKDPATGEEGLPPVPYSELNMHFFSGARAVLITPSECGRYATSATLTPWSGAQPVESPSYFTIDQGCGANGFAPAFTAGPVNPQAGAYTTFEEAFSRNDREQRLQRIEQTLPQGVLAKLAGVRLCGNAEASAGACPEASQVGIVKVDAGPGPDPLSVTGRVYLTGPYGEGPLGVAVEVPAVAGPFNLDEDGKPITVRGSVKIDPTTAQATIATDPFPTMLQGVPVDVRSVEVAVNRPGFVFNPTNCEPLEVTARVLSTAEGEHRVAKPMAAVNCATLPFNPTFKVSTQAKTSKASGASLIVHVAEKPGEANIHKVDLQLPIALPARLTTLQKACTEKQFDANPAGCPEGSLIGTATARTPVLANPVTGPAYLVSHGNAAFPDVEFVLQGGESGSGPIKIVLDGQTDIKKGITYSKFETVPDVPVTSFEAVLPEGPHSVLTVAEPGRTNLCEPTRTETVKRRVTVRGHGRIEHRTKTVTKLVAEPLTIPTTITGQNGAVIVQRTAIEVTGCPRATAKTKKKAKKKR